MEKKKQGLIGRMKNSLLERDRNIAVNMLQDGVDVRMISTITSLAEDEILEIKDLMDVGYGESIFDMDHARKIKAAKNMVRDGIPLEIVKTVSQLTTAEALSLEG